MPEPGIKPETTWDPFVRIFHWSLVGFFFLAYCLEGDRLEVHSHAGYTVALLVVFRLVWGVVGSTHARFGDFVVGPAPTITYLKQLLRGGGRRYVGHDPAGAVMIWLLLASLLITTLSGMSLFALEGRGPLASTLVGSFIASWQGALVEDVHDFSADFTVWLIVFHVLGVLAASLLRRENLIVAMLTGRKKP